ncbi:MAG: hypothetical protein LBL16_05030 [Endomicrobium sp.]|jgi:hypothetical protein|nr:hypothetical protein [Endomicrobium sp.]
MPKIKDLLKDVLTKSEYDIWVEPIVEHTSGQTNSAILIVPNIYFKNRISEILKSQNLSAEVIIHKQEDLKTTQQPPSEIKQSLNTKTLQMEKPYSKEKVATSDIVNSKFFTYPITNSRLKYATTEMILNGEEYIIHRGKTTPNLDEEPIGQLDTNHLRILLAIIHTWQDQNCKFLGVTAIVKISFSIREIAKKIEYKISGRTIKWLQQKIEELKKYPITLERKSDGRANSFTFLNELTKQTKEKNTRKSIIVLTLNPILSQQLYERKAILRNKDCYKIKNPTSLKFLLTYDKRIYASQEQFKLSIEDIAEDLELRGTTQNITKAISKVVKNLNGYKLTDNSEISLELAKEGRERYLIVGKREVVPTLPLGMTTEISAIEC